MKKIINRKLYDTTTAQEIAFDSNNYSKRNHAWVEETLYRKKTGEFFLYGEGGPASAYAERLEGNARIEGQKIVPLTYDEAESWAEKHLSADEFISIFGEPVESDDVKDCNFRLPVSTAERLKLASSRTGKTQAQILIDLINTL